MKKKIIHVVNNRALNGGIGTVLDYLDEGLRENNLYDSSVLTTYSQDDGKFGYESLKKNGNFGEHIYNKNFLEQELAQYDVVHIHGIPSYRILEAVEALKGKGQAPKIVNTCHSSVKKELAAHYERSKNTGDGRALERMIDNGILEKPGRYCDNYWGSAIFRQEKVMTLADKVQHMNNAYLDDIVEEYSAHENKDKHSVVYNGIELLNEDELTTRPKDKRLLYCGRFAAEKGIDEFIESLPSIFEKHPDTKVKIMGGDKDGIQVEKYKRKVKEELSHKFGDHLVIDYLDNIDFTGWVTDKKEIKACYEWTDFLVMPSKDESFCLAIAEALNHKRIPIMTDTHSLRDLYLSKDAGLGIDENKRTGQGIADVVNFALDEIDQPWMEIMAETGRELVKENYSLEKVLEQQVRLYESL